MIKLATAHRIIELTNWVKELRKDIAEMDSGEVGVVTVRADYKGPKPNGSYYHSEFKRDMQFDGDDARRLSNLIRQKKQLRLDAYIRELRQLDAEVVDG